MEEKKNPTAATGGQPTPTRDDEATSSETLSDIEGSAKVSGGSGAGSESSSSLEGSSPAPQPDDGGRADGSDTGGPM